MEVKAKLSQVVSPSPYPERPEWLPDYGICGDCTNPVEFTQFIVFETNGDPHTYMAKGLCNCGSTSVQFGGTDSDLAKEIIDDYKVEFIQEGAKFTLLEEEIKHAQTY